MKKFLNVVCDECNDRCKCVIGFDLEDFEDIKDVGLDGCGIGDDGHFVCKDCLKKALGMLE